MRERDQHFVQCTEEDVKEKALLVPQRITDTYLKYADCIDFYYRTEVEADAIHTATWIRASSELTIHDSSAYDAMVSTHNLICEKLGKNELLWEKAVEEDSTIIRYD